jgi:hypothetical protein
MYKWACTPHGIEGEREEDWIEGTEVKMWKVCVENKWNGNDERSNAMLTRTCIPSSDTRVHRRLPCGVSGRLPEDRIVPARSPRHG